MHGELIDITTTDGRADAYFSRPDGGTPRPAVLMLMDAIGLRPRLFEMADRLAGHGYAVLLPNLFYRSGRAPVVPLPDLTQPEQRAALFEKLGPIGAALTTDRAIADTQAYLDFLRASPHVRPGPIGVVGYCMGGAMALRVAAAYPDDVIAAASFHGARLATDAPDSPHLGAPKIKAELYFGHADQDPSLTPEQITRLEAALDAAEVRYSGGVYGGAAHGFTMADTAVYDEVATEQHWVALLQLLHRNLPG